MELDETMTINEAEETLIDAIKVSDEYKEFIHQRENAFADPVSSALLKEYENLQTKLQMYALTGKEAAQNDIDRFTQLNGLMTLSPQTGAYLLSKVRMHKLLADVFSRLSEACQLPIEMPNL